MDEFKRARDLVMILLWFRIPQVLEDALFVNKGSQE